MTRGDLDKLADDHGLDITVADGFDDAIVGIATRYGWDRPVVVYDRKKVLEIIGKDADPEAAMEHFQFNVIGAWVGEGTPIYLITDPEDVP